MNTEHVVDEANLGPHKYRRVIPIIGLLFYYLGCLIVSLEVVENIVFLLQIAIFSVILLAGLQYPQNKIAIIIGAILVIVGSLGPIANLILSIQDGIIGFGVLGGSLVLVGVFFQLVTIILWLKES